MPVKVSVIVPTFRSGDGIERVVASLDAQTLPADEFEVIFVDDGSGDDTVGRLKKIATTRANVRVIEIENSGWGSRPRNVGIDAAIGEYVTFVDHDDSLFPDALRSAYEAGRSIDADFVNPKETTTRGWSWGWEVWREDRSLTTRDQMTPRDVTPLIPHKLYKRSFLNDHGIRFPEGPRAFWEDFYVNTEVFVHAERIAILASVPFYKWHRSTGSNSSDMLYEDVEEYWGKLSEVARFMEQTVTDAAARRWLLINHYRWWVVDLFGPRGFARDPRFVADSLPYLRGYLARWVPEAADAELDAALAATAALMRAGDLEHLELLARIDRGLDARAAATTVEWTPGGLRVRAEATWTAADGSPLLFERDGERVIRVLPPELADVLSPDVLDVRRDVDAAWGGINVRSRGDRVSWRIPTESAVSLDDRGGGLVSVRATVEGTVDPATAVFGRPLEEGVWEVGARFGFMGVERHAGAGYEGSTLPAIAGGRPVVVYPTAKRVLALDVAATRKPFVTPGRLDAASARFDRGEARIPMRGVAALGALDGEVAVRYDGGDPHAGRIDVAAGSAILVVPLPTRRGSHTWRVTVGGAESKDLPPIRIGALGGAKFAS